MSFIYKHAIKKGKFRTAAGYPANVILVSSDKILSGVVKFGDDNRLHVQWDQFGVPLKLPEDQYLNLVPLREVISYEPIPIEEQI